MKGLPLYITIFMLLTGTNVLWSQQIGFAHDWQAVIRKYNSLEGMEVSSTYYLYGNHNATKPSEMTQAVVARKSKNIYQKIDRMEYIVSDQYMAMVDHDEKIIVFDRSIKGFSPYTPDISLDYLREFITSEKVLKNNISEKQYEIHFSEGEIEKIITTIDKSSFLLKDMTLYYSEKEDVDDENKTILVKQKLKIVFTAPKTISKHFYTVDDNPYFTFTKDRIALKSKYKYYELIDNRLRQ